MIGDFGGVFVDLQLGTIEVPISVVMAVYNGRKFLLRQVTSILSQLEPGDELIIVDDASTDGSADMLTALQSPHIAIHRNVENTGVVGSFERGLRLARQDVIFLSDQDDVWLPGKRSAFTAEFERDPATLVVVSDAQLIDVDGDIVADSFMAVRHGFRDGVLSTLWRNRYLGCAMAVRRSLLEVALPIPRNVPMHDMWLGLLGKLNGKVAFLERPYLQYRRHSKNMTPLYSQLRWKSMVVWRLQLGIAIVMRMLSAKSGMRDS